MEIKPKVLSNINVLSNSQNISNRTKEQPLKKSNSFSRQQSNSFLFEIAANVKENLH